MTAESGPRAVHPIGLGPAQVAIAFLPRKSNEATMGIIAKKAQGSRKIVAPRPPAAMTAEAFAEAFGGCTTGALDDREPHVDQSHRDSNDSRPRVDEASRVFTMLAAPGTSTRVAAEEIVRAEGESDAAYARRQALVMELWSIAASK
jgi:hypothetical protein